MQKGKENFTHWIIRRSLARLARTKVANKYAAGEREWKRILADSSPWERVAPGCFIRVAPAMTASGNIGSAALAHSPPLPCTWWKCTNHSWNCGAKTTFVRLSVLILLNSRLLHFFAIQFALTWGFLKSELCTAKILTEPQERAKFCYISMNFFTRQRTEDEKWVSYLSEFFLMHFLEAIGNATFTILLNFYFNFCISLISAD